MLATHAGNSTGRKGVFQNVIGISQTWPPTLYFARIVVLLWNTLSHNSEHPDHRRVEEISNRDLWASIETIHEQIDLDNCILEE